MSDLPDRLTINGIEYAKADGEPNPDVNFESAILRNYRIGQKEIVGPHTFKQKESGMSLWATGVSDVRNHWLVPPLYRGTEITVHNVMEKHAITLSWKNHEVRLKGQEVIGPGVSVVLVWGPAKIVKVIGPNAARSE